MAEERRFVEGKGTYCKETDSFNITDNSIFRKGMLSNHIGLSQRAYAERRKTAKAIALLESGHRKEQILAKKAGFYSIQTMERSLDFLKGILC